MLTVSLRPLLHRGQENIAVCYEQDHAINNQVRKLKGVRWSQAHRCWYVPLNESSIQSISGALDGIAITDDCLLTA